MHGFSKDIIPDDFDALYAVLADFHIMQHYPYTFWKTIIRLRMVKSYNCIEIEAIKDTVWHKLIVLCEPAAIAE